MARADVSSTDAFETLYRQHVQSVYRFALRCVSRKDLAEDLTSEAFLALFRNIDQHRRVTAAGVAAHGRAQSRARPLATAGGGGTVCGRIDRGVAGW